VSTLTRLRQKYDVVAREAAKFGIVGAVNTVLDFVVLNVMVLVLGVPPLRSKVASTVVAATSSYLMNRHWTFRHRENQAVRKEYAVFFGLNAVALGISLTVLAVFRYGLGLEGALWLNLANVVAIGFGTVFRFWSYRRFVWLAPGSVETAADEGDYVAAVALDLDPRHAEDARPAPVSEDAR
jgi:putative flippase GtrA